MLKHDLLHKWNIENKVNLVVCENVANMVCAMGAANTDHISCTAHTLQLVIKDSLFSHKHVSKLLKEYNKQNNVPRHQLVQDEPTRWDSTYLTVERLLEQRRAITWLFPDLNLQTDLSSQDWNLLEQVYSSLRFSMLLQLILVVRKPLLLK
ncbi:hypothetical protein PR048_005114 [Dryococelus australis]|uniref:Transposase n=1 Tax=Dryococelus australis TaxID=614101 RepID=A0ABQ9I7A9_9NEOP|nr:hypothetical protein PR048_005114 [Dryococelus australis]